MIFIRMASQLGFSEFNKDQKPNMELLSNMYKKRKNKTIRKRAKLPSAKAEEFLNSMKNYSENMEEMDGDGEGLANFNPPPKAELTKIPEDVVENLDNQNSLNQPADDNAVTVEGYNNLNNDVMKSYYDSYVPYYNNPQNQSTFQNKDELMKKLNYLIHLMEENKDEPNKNVTEELVLYMFLGVFTIFVIDSFARAGKYTR
tara:strand:- start:543 stop:1145 length:603 start_codon:yes stop_codon:yes gene_type:complete